MNFERLQEIIDSPALINVYYHGVPVIIQQVDEFTQTATIFPLNNMKYRQVVNITELIEEEPIPYMNGGITMDRQRAQEIAQSPNMKQVTYNGEQVYIQHIDENRNIARIFPLNDPENEFEVQISSLKEEEK